MSPNSASSVSQCTSTNSAPHETAYADWYSKKQAESPLQRAEARQTRADRKVPLVAVVDDEVTVAVTLSEVLRRHGYNAVWFSDSMDALAFLERGPVDLLLCDVTMLLLDGIELATKVYSLQPSCRLFLFSALADYPDVADRIVRSGLKVHLEAKPLQIHHLVSTLALLLELDQAPKTYVAREEQVGV